MRGKALVCCVAISVSVFFSTLGRLALGQSWTSSGPIARYLSTAVLNTTTNRMIVFGGTDLIGNTTAQTDRNDVWWLNGAGTGGLNWVPVRPGGAPPAPRVGHSAVYDQTNDRMVVFGGGLGQSSPCANDVWVLTNAAHVTGTPIWTQLAPSGSSPAPRLVHTAVYDPTTNSMIIFGGDNCFSTFFNDVWVLSNANGLGGTPAWTQLAPTGTAPSPREYSSAVYDFTNNRMIVFAGSDTTGPLNEVWVLSNANGSGGTPGWTQLSPTGGPPAARDSATAVYDGTNNRMTIFGGNSSTVDFGDAWVLSNANGLGGSPAWAELGPFSTFTEARTGHTAVYNASTNKMTVFGGIVTLSESLATNDVWVLSHANGL